MSTTNCQCCSDTPFNYAAASTTSTSSSTVVGSGVLAFDTWSEMQNSGGFSTLDDGDMIILWGYISKNDMGGSLFRWDATSLAADDGCKTMKPTNFAGTQPGRAVRVLFGGQLPTAEMGGAVPDGVTDNTSAIQRVVDAFDACYFGPDGIYGMMGYVTLDSWQVVGKLTISQAHLQHLTNMAMTVGAANGLLNWGSVFHPDVFFCNGSSNFTEDIKIDGLILDCNAENRKATGAGTNTEDGTYWPGSDPIHLVGEGMEITNVTVTNFGAYSGVKTQTYVDQFSSNPVTAIRRVGLPEAFGISCQIQPVASSWMPYPDDYVYQKGPRIENCVFKGPMARQLDPNDFPITQTGTSFLSPEYTCILVNGFIRTADTTSVAGKNMLVYPYQTYDKPKVKGCRFEDITIFRNSDTDKQIRSIHCITVGNCRDMEISGNVGINVDGPLYYLDNTPVLGGFIKNNIGRGMLTGITIPYQAYSVGTGRIGSGAWFKDVYITGNDIQNSGISRLNTVYVDKEAVNVLANVYAIYANGMNTNLGANNIIWPVAWNGTRGLDGTNAYSGDTIGGILYDGEDIFPATATQPQQQAFYENVKWDKNKLVAQGVDIEDTSQYYNAVLYFGSYTQAVPFMQVGITENFVDQIHMNTAGDLEVSAPISMLAAAQVYQGLFVSHNVNNTGEIGLREVLSDSVSWGVSSFYSTGYPTISNNIFNEASLSAADLTIQVDAVNGNLIYLNGNGRGDLDAGGFSKNSLVTFSSQTTLDWNADINLCLPYPDDLTVNGRVYNGCAPIGMIFRISNVSAAHTVHLYVPNEKAQQGATPGGVALEDVGPTTTKNYLAYAPGVWINVP